MGYAEQTALLCSDCGSPFHDPAVGTPGFIFTCAECGSHNYTRFLHVTDQIGLWDLAKLKTKPGDRAPGERPFDIELTIGSELHRDTATLRHVERRLSRRENSYRELITDKDGNVLRAVDEPLSEHQGRGAAARRLPGDTPDQGET